MSEQSTALAIGTFDDLLKRSEFLAKSELVPVALRGKPANVAVILQMGLELGIPPMQAINGIDCIQGKPAISPQLGLALVRSKLPNFFVKVETSPEAVSVTVGRDRDRPEEFYTATFGDAQAKAMQLSNKDNYIKQKHTMYRWRATMEALRFVASDILKGFYSDDEAENIPPPSDDTNDKVARLALLNKKPELKEVVAEVAPQGAQVGGHSEVAAPAFADLPPVPTIAPPPKAEDVPFTTPPMGWGMDLRTRVETPKEPEFDPIGDYVLKGMHSYKGYKIKDHADAELLAFIERGRAWAKETGKPLTGHELMDISRIDEWLRSREAGFSLEPGATG